MLTISQQNNPAWPASSHKILQFLKRILSIGIGFKLKPDITSTSWLSCSKHSYRGGHCWTILASLSSFEQSFRSQTWMVFVNRWGSWVWLLNNRKPFQHLVSCWDSHGMDAPWFPKMSTQAQYFFLSKLELCLSLRVSESNLAYIRGEKVILLRNTPPWGSLDRKVGCLDRHWFPFITNCFPISTALNYTISSQPTRFFCAWRMHDYASIPCSVKGKEACLDGPLVSLERPGCS